MASGLVCITLPMTTCAMLSGATFDWASAAFAAWTPRSVALSDLSAPCMVPNAVRLAATMTIDLESLGVVMRMRVSGEVIPGNLAPRRAGVKGGRGSERRVARRGPGPADHDLGALLHAHRKRNLSGCDDPPLRHERVPRPDRALERPVERRELRRV